MKIAAIVAEYNPFHNGHKYQIDRARDLLGKDTAIVVIMSGNYTQRGEVAIADKLIRAEAAVQCGVDLVLELPHPYSMSSAEFFAKSSIEIIDKLGVVDYLVFGVEDCTLDELYGYVETTESEEFRAVLKKLLSNPNYSRLGYPKLCEKAYSQISKDKNTEKFSTPNNILAVEYLRALRTLKSDIIPTPITRKGAGYNDSYIIGEDLQSASAIRTLIMSNDSSAFDYIPENAKEVFLKAIKSGKMPSDEKRLSEALITGIRLNSPSLEDSILDASGGLYNRLTKLSFEANSIQSLMSLAETKKYTKARIRRAIWNMFFGVTSSEIRKSPAFTQILATSSLGRRVLKRIPKRTDFHIFNKPSRTKGLGEDVLCQKSRADRADSVYGLTLPCPNKGGYYLTVTPYVKEE